MKMSSLLALPTEGMSQLRSIKSLKVAMGMRAHISHHSDLVPRLLTINARLSYQVKGISSSHPQKVLPSEKVSKSLRLLFKRELQMITIKTSRLPYSVSAMDRQF